MQYKILCSFLGLISFTSIFAQVEIDKPIHLSGEAGERSIKYLEPPVDGTDAANKDYVDQEIAANGGGSGLFIGESTGGGVVFQTFKDAAGTEHGLVVSLIDNSAGTTWSNVTATSVGTTNYWDGEASTAAIIAQAGHTSSAAQICSDYSGGGFTDWFLPAQAQLFLLWTNSYMVNQTLADIGGAELLAPDSYWSSTETTNTTVRRLFFNPNNFTLLSQDKTSSFRVRCVRVL